MLFSRLDELPVDGAVYINVGSNDLANRNNVPPPPPAEVAQDICGLVQDVVNQHIGCYYIMDQFHPRIEAPTGFYPRARATNAILKHRLGGIDNASFSGFWQVKNLRNPLPHLYLPDGVHLNDHGNERLFWGVRRPFLQFAAHSEIPI
jgi:hypothetical protein